MCTFCVNVYGYLSMREDYFRLTNRRSDYAKLLWSAIQALERRLGFLFARELALGRVRGSYRWDHQ